MIWPHWDSPSKMKDKRLHFLPIGPLWVLELTYTSDYCLHPLSDSQSYQIRVRFSIRDLMMKADALLLILYYPADLMDVNGIHYG